MTRVVIVFGAGGAGCAVRYLISLWAGERFGTAFPYGTLIVNVVGSFLMALIMELSLRLTAFPDDLKLALTTGFLGGLTTYSAFNYESSALALDGETGRSLANIGITLVGGVAAGLLGLGIARALLRAVS
ncbi:MAG: CrcB family protein [Deltaproteobacteria bacterium]|nr:CrcB family protein [Deltaproteobacteria bacterium]